MEGGENSSLDSTDVDVEFTSLEEDGYVMVEEVKNPDEDVEKTDEVSMTDEEEGDKDNSLDSTDVDVEFTSVEEDVNVVTEEVNDPDEDVEKTDGDEEEEEGSDFDEDEITITYEAKWKRKHSGIDDEFDDLIDESISSGSDAPKEKKSRPPRKRVTFAVDGGAPRDEREKKGVSFGVKETKEEEKHEKVERKGVSFADGEAPRNEREKKGVSFGVEEIKEEEKHEKVERKGVSFAPEKKTCMDPLLDDPPKEMSEEDIIKKKEEEEEAKRLAIEEAWDKANAEREAEKRVVEDEGGWRLADSPLSYESTISHFLESDFSQLKSQIVVENELSTSEKLLNCLFCGLISSSLLSSLHEERDAFFCIAKMKFDENVIEHFRILSTLYHVATGERRPCLRSGTHWQKIGFQGEDPVTDLRGTGMLGPLQLRAFQSKHPQLSQDMYLLSIDDSENHEFPFVLTGFHFTKGTMDAMRDRCLYNECNAQESVFDVANEFFAAMMYEFYRRWKDGKYTVEHFSVVLKEITDNAKLHVSETLQQFKRGMNEKDAYIAVVKSKERELTHL